MTKSVFKFILLLISSICFGQNIAGNYKLKNKDYTITFNEDGTFDRAFSVSWCGTLISTVGTYKIESNQLILDYKELDYDNPLVIEKSITKSKRLDSLQTIEVEIFDKDLYYNVTEFFNIENKYDSYFVDEKHNLNKIIIQSQPKETTYVIKSLSDKPIAELEVIKDNNYHLRIIIDGLVDKKEVFKILRVENDFIVLKDLEIGKRLKFIKTKKAQN